MKITQSTATQQGVAERLSDYVTQANLYHLTKKKAKGIKQKCFSKSALVVLAPLAAQAIAMPYADAQCNLGAIKSDYMQNTANCNRKLALDFDGDGNYDIAFEFLQGPASSFVIASAINPMLTISAGTLGTISMSLPLFAADNAATGMPASGYMFNDFDGTNGFLLSANGNLGDFATPSGSSSVGYLAIQEAGKYGFIGIEIDHSTAGDRCLSIVEYGIETPTNTATVLVGDCNTLPVELTQFAAKATETTIELAWQTSSELHNLGFELQRSIDAKDYRKIAWINGNGTTSEMQQYHFKDDKVLANQVYYYRLKQIDRDGNFEYSTIVSAAINDKDALKIGDFYPNPTANETHIQIQTHTNTDVQIQLYDYTGRMLQSYAQSVDSGNNELRLSLENIDEGIYYVRIDAAQERTYRKLSVVKN